MSNTRSGVLNTRSLNNAVGITPSSNQGAIPRRNAKEDKHMNKEEVVKEIKKLPHLEIENMPTKRSPYSIIECLLKAAKQIEAVMNMKTKSVVRE